MSEIFTNILTKIGQQKKAQAETPNGTALNITTFKVGDGNGAYYEPNENQTALVNVKYTGTFIAGTQSQIIVNPSAANEVLYKCFIPADVGGFTIRELGLFDADGDLILICKLPAQDKFPLASGVYQPLTFTPKIIYTNPQTQAVLTPASQIVPIKSEIATMISESIQTIDNHTHFNKNYLDLVSGTNTGDQDLSNLATKIFDNIIPTTALLNLGFAGQSLASNGYYKLPNGLIFQWGQIINSISEQTTLSFPLEFPNTCLNAVCSLMFQSSTSRYERYIYSFSKSQITITNYDANGITNWIAIGY